MPQITQIQPQKRRKDRLNVFLADKFAFSISPDNLIIFKLKVGKNLQENEIKEILKKEMQNYLIDAALNFLSFRPRSVKETTDFLTRKVAKLENLKFAEAKESSLIKNTINFLKKRNFLNDQEFANWLISARENTKGKKALKLELFQKGVKGDVLEKSLESFEENIKTAYKLIEKKLPRWSKLPRIEQKKKIYNYLAYRGFSHDTIKELFAKFLKIS